MLEVLSELRGGGRHCPQGYPREAPSEKSQAEGAAGSPHDTAWVHSSRKRALCAPALDLLSHMDGELSLAFSLSSPNPCEM